MLQNLFLKIDLKDRKLAKTHLAFKHLELRKKMGFALHFFWKKIEAEREREFSKIHNRENIYYLKTQKKNRKRRGWQIFRYL